MRAVRIIPGKSGGVKEVMPAVRLEARGRLVLYGCVDFLDDYEGIGGGFEELDDLGLW